jgi:hypothetical protein
MTQLGSRRDQIRDPALTTMLIVLGLIIFIASPCVAGGYAGSRTALELLQIIFAFLTVLVSQGRITTAIATLAMIVALTGSTFDRLSPSTATLVMNQIGTLGACIVVAYVVGRAVFAPGLVTAHRVRGAIVLYLGFGLMCSNGYRLMWDLIPGALGGIAKGTDSWQAAGSILYFSFVTLTSIGFGDIVPVHPFARALANFEGIVGQLYPATLLARLVTLELESRRR